MDATLIDDPDSHERGFPLTDGQSVVQTSQPPLLPCPRKRHPANAQQGKGRRDGE